MPSKSAVRAFCKAARKGELSSVQAMLTADPSLLDAPVSAPPKKDDGQSALQVALKCGSRSIAAFLIDAGADVNYMEAQSANAWRAPVLHDALRACVFSDNPQRSLALVETMLTKGADANKRDSYGNSPLGRAMLDAKQVLHMKAKWETLPPIFALLLAHGADPHAACDTRAAVDEDSRGYEAYRFLVEGMGAEHSWQEAVWRDDASALTGSEPPDAAGRTPLLTAAIFGSTQVVENRIAAGTDLSITDAAGYSALALAWWSVPVSTLLLEAGADPNQPIGDTGKTPFSRSFYKRELPDLMLAHGADRSTRNAQGKTYDEVQAKR